MWDKLTVGQFISLYDVETNENLNIVERQQIMLGIIEDRDHTEYDSMKYRTLLETFKVKLDFFNNVPECKAVDFIEVNGNRYKFCFELTEITAGQYIDITTFSGQIMQLNKIAACFFLPMQGDKYMEYGSVPHQKVSDDMLSARFVDIYGCMLFFYQLFKELISDTIISSNMKEEAKEAMARLWKDGVGYIVQSK